MAEVSRNNQILEQVVFLDGLSGTGKTMIGPVLCSFSRVEIHRLEHLYEYVSALRYLGRIESDAAIALLRMYADLACYNVMIARESNFRWADLSSVLRNSGRFRYLLRLFQSDGDAVIKRIATCRPILQIISHQVLSIALPLFEAFGERLRIVEMVRHPLYLLEHWYSCIDRFGRDSREFTICICYKGVELPWFAYGWEDRYVRSNKMDRVIHTIHRLTVMSHDVLRVVDEATRSRILVIPFERFVQDPWPFLSRIEELLGSKRTRATSRVLRKQKIPRQLWAAGRDLKIYRRYDWEPPSKNSTEVHELKKRWDVAAREATGEGLAVLGRLCEQYEEKYLKRDLSPDSFAGGDFQGVER